MSEPKELAVRQEQLAASGDPIIALLQNISAGPISGDSVGVAERVLAMYERQIELKGKQDFAKAFAALQAQMPPVQATKPVPNKDGSLRYKYAPFEEIMAKVKPVADNNGFSITFDMAFGDARVKSICTLMHIGGHSRSNEYAVRIGNGPPGSNETQADGAAITYAKRGALCNALNIVVEHDTDGNDDRSLGAPVGAKGAELRRRLVATSGDESAFLNFAHGEAVTTRKDFKELPSEDQLALYVSIPDARLSECERVLSEREHKKRQAEDNEPEVKF